MSTVKKIQTWTEFKSENRLDSVPVYQSSSGKRFIRIAGERIALAEDVSMSKPMVVITMEDDDENSWSFIAQEKDTSVKIGEI